jgi:quercetin dioxygenase-like cupin family protein
MDATTNGVDSQVPQPIRGERGGTIAGPRNLPLERELPDLLVPPSTDSGTLPNMWFPFAGAHMRLSPGGWSREVTVRELPNSPQIAGVNMRLNPGDPSGVREMHWHTQAEWGYVLTGAVRVTAIDQDGHNFVDDVGVGDLWTFPAGNPHSIQALSEGCEFLLVFDDGTFSENNTFLLSDLFLHMPLSVLAKNFGVPEAAFANIPRRSSTSSPLPPRDRSPPTRLPLPMGWCPKASVGASASKSRSNVPEARCASSIPAPSWPPRRSPPRWWRSSQAACARSTGTPTPMSGSTTWKAKHA